MDPSCLHLGVKRLHNAAPSSPWQLFTGELQPLLLAANLPACSLLGHEEMGAGFQFGALLASGRMRPEIADAIYEVPSAQPRPKSGPVHLGRASVSTAEWNAHRQRICPGTWAGGLAAFGLGPPARGRHRRAAFRAAAITAVPQPSWMGVGDTSAEHGNVCRPGDLWHHDRQ